MTAQTRRQPEKAGQIASLRDLIESRAARHGLAPRTLWKVALDAIVRDVLLVILPDGNSLDTKFNLRGEWLSWREVFNRVLPSMDRREPSYEFWANDPMCDAAVFDNWLESAFNRNETPVHPKRTAGAKRKTPREELASFIHAKYGLPLSAGITYKQIAKDFEAETGLHVIERTVARALGRK